MLNFDDSNKWNIYEVNEALAYNTIECSAVSINNVLCRKYLCCVDCKVMKQMDKLRRVLYAKH